MISLYKAALAGVAAIVAVTGLAVPAQAQRDPAYAAARANGTIGEKPDGYLGIVGSETPELRRLVDGINIKRRAVYTERARAEKATVEAYAFTAGCQAIMRTASGEKYQSPDGTWQTRGGAAPIRDSRCI